VITPRTTRLVRAVNLQAFREATATLALDGPPRAARDRLVIVPTSAAAAQLRRTIEDAVDGDRGCLLPDLVTRDQMVHRFAERLPLAAGGDGGHRRLTDTEREVLLGSACRAARAAGFEPPFRLRPGLVAEILAFYDALRRNRKDVETFERLTLGMLEPGAAYDRGAERLVRQTRFLVAALREFERRVAAAGVDEHMLRRELVQTASPSPYRHVVLTVGDRAFDPYGLTPADWDLLARIPALERIDLVITDRKLAGGLHERVHHVLPGIEEVRFETVDAVAPERGQRQDVSTPRLAVPSGDALVHSARDREEEVAGFARWVKHLMRHGEVTTQDRVALIVRQPLPYVYVAREVLRSAGVPCQLFDALPLAAEPYAAALDLVFSCVAANFSRAAAIAVLRSPHFRFVSPEGERLSQADIAALDRALCESGYLGDIEALEQVRLQADTTHAGAAILLEAARALHPLCSPASVADHVATLLSFLERYESPIRLDDPLRSRHLRARGAILATLEDLRDAYAQFDSGIVAFDEVAALIRRRIEVQTFAPRTGESGVHLVDAASAAYGTFEHAQLAGLVDGEWPDPPRRCIFYSTSILRDLGWPAESERLAGARAAFADLLHLPSRRVAASTFLLEDDGLVSPSSLIDEIEHARLEYVEERVPAMRIFDYEALAFDPLDTEALSAVAREWVSFRQARRESRTPAPRPPCADGDAYAVSSLERYQDCPFKYFAADVLQLEEAPDDEDVLSPRARGRFVHEVLQQFFHVWEQRGSGPIAPERMEEARQVFAGVAEPMLSRLPETDAALERTRLFGSAISTGIADVVLGIEAEADGEVRERWLEHRLAGGFSLGVAGGRRVSLTGVADRIDLLDGRRLRVIDYKTGSAPNPRRALQVPIYALCAQERLCQRDGAPWQVDQAAYLALAGKRTLVPLVRSSKEADEVLAAARVRLLALVDRINAGEFPPQPYDPAICRYCAYASVCRKDYVE
jgi:RecB family exonuclease